MSNNLTTFRPNTNKEKFSYSGSGQSTVQRVNDISQATRVQSVSGETLTLGAGAAGTTGKVSTRYAPIMDTIGRKLGYYFSATDNDTSVSITHLALAGDEVKFDEYKTDTEIYATLDDGEYTIDYTNGLIYYKKGTADTAGTIDYKYTNQDVNIEVGDISIGDVTSNGQNIATEATLDNIKDSLTDESQIAQAYGVYNATEPTLTDTEKAPLQLNENGELKVTGGAGASSVSAEYISPLDFTATYTSSSTLTLSGVPITINDSSQIAYIKQVKADNTSRTYVNGANDITLAYSAGVITIYEKGTAAASLVAGDVYEVGINGTTKAYDLSTNANKTISLVNVWNRYTDAETLVTAQDLTDTYADYGAEIDMSGYTHLRVGIVLDVNDSTDITLKALGLNEAGGIDEFEIEGGSTQTIAHTADAKYSYEFDVKGSPFVQLQAKAETVGATPGDLTISITKMYKGA